MLQCIPWPDSIGMQLGSCTNMVSGYYFYTPIMLVVGSHGATDVTGFGILGHLRNLASNQKQDVSFCLHSLPGMLYVWLYVYMILSLIVLGGMFTVAEAAAAAEGGINFTLKEGFSAETSG